MTPAKREDRTASCAALIVVGPTCAGKTTMGRYLAERHGYLHVEASSVVDLLRKREQPDADPLRYAKRLIATRGRDVVAVEILRQNPHLLDGRFVLTGFRLREEIDLLARFCPRLKTAFLDADVETRLNRYLQGRHVLHATDHEADFFRKEKVDSSFGLVHESRSRFDFLVENSGTIADLRRRIDRMVAAIEPASTPDC